MKKTIMAALLAGFLVNTGSFPSAAMAAEVAVADSAGPVDIVPAQSPASGALAPPVFSLQDDPADSPAAARKKAALRLFKAYGATMAQLSACRGQTPGADKAIQGFTSRNGNTLARVTAVIKQHGGISPEIKTGLDSAIAEEAAKPVNCQSLIKTVADGERDIYKAPPYLDDYKRIRGK